jgi:acyl-CoA thioesterase
MVGMTFPLRRVITMLGVAHAQVAARAGVVQPLLRLTWLNGTPRSAAYSRGMPSTRSLMTLRGYEPIPTRDGLAKALIAYFTGHLGISTTMRAHEGIGTAQAHLTVSTAPMTVTVSFHEPVRWDGWILFSHESTQVGAGMSHVRGAVHTEEGELIASFSQDRMIRPLRTTDTNISAHSRL